MEALVVSPSEAKKMLLISSNRIYEMLEEGELPAYREGKDWKIPVKILQDYVLERAYMETKERKK